MATLKHDHLGTLTLTVDFAGITEIGPVPAGVRRIAPVTGGHFVGARLRGTILPGADWVIHRPDGIMLIDVRLVLQSDDGASIYLTYQGRFLADPVAMAGLARGEALDPDDYSLAMVARLECGAARYHWLNDVVAVGTGRQRSDGVVYEIFTIG